LIATVLDPSPESTMVIESSLSCFSCERPKAFRVGKETYYMRG
jgi:hypothetical protein